MDVVHWLNSVLTQCLIISPKRTNSQMLFLCYSQPLIFCVHPSVLIHYLYLCGTKLLNPLFQNPE